MNKKFKNMIALVLVAVLVAGWLPPVSTQAAGADTSPVGELVDHYASGSGTFALTEQSRILVVSDREPTGDILQTAQLIARQFAADGRPTGNTMDLLWGQEAWAQAGDIVLVEDATVDAEGYSLEVGEVARICFSDVRGMIYGGNMLLKHLRYANSNTLAGFQCADTPDTKQRAVSLDCGRKYYTKDWICNFIREMSWMGYNALQFHFSDDSGFRFDLWDEDYYKGQFQPENDFSWICGSNYTSWTLAAYQNDEDKGKFLTTAEVVEILQTAAEYHIDVIPCFDSPSHLDYLTWTFEKYYDSNPSYSFYSTYDQKTYYAKDVNGIINYTNSRDWSTDLRWPYYSAVNVKGDLAKAFVFELYIDIANFFKEYAGSDHMSVGADEVQLSTSNISSSYKYAWGFPDFVNYINELNDLLNAMGYTMRMYNDFLGSTAYNATNYEFADNIQIQYWDSPFNPSSKTATNHTQPVSYYVNEGRIIYNCIQTGTYYALRKTSAGSDARSVRNRQWTFYHANEEDIWDEWYSTDISEHGDYSEDVADVPAANLGGAYFLIWGDYACVSTEKEIWNGVYDTDGSGEYYSLRDRMWSNITKQWNWDVNETVDFADFVEVRDAYGDHPGIGTTTNSCSQPTQLPDAPQIQSVYQAQCECYNAYGKLVITTNCNMMNQPCGEDIDSAAEVVKSLFAGSYCTAVGLYTNTAGELWYEVVLEDGEKGYVNAVSTGYLEDLTDDIVLEDANWPSGIEAGKSFSIQGNLSASRNILTEVSVDVYRGFGLTGEWVIGASDTVSDNAYSLLSSTVDNGTSFGKLTEGEYTYVVSAKYTTHYAGADSVVSKTESVVLLEQCFLALSATADQTACSHSYEETVVREATCLDTGLVVQACGTCGLVNQQYSPKSGHSYEVETVGATCTDFEKLCYTCIHCGDSYLEYPQELYTQWQEEKPEGLGSHMVQTKTEYRYRDYETATSSSAAMEGFTQIGSAWLEIGKGTVEYVNSWPAGFSTANTLYTKYNNKSQKVTAYEEDTAKRVIDSDAVSGYLYYHWCYSGSYYSVASQSGRYTVFHAYYSTVDPSSYTCDTSAMSYQTSHSTCSNSDWFFVTNVYTQSYTDYEKQYQFERWTDWSDWSETPVEEVENRQVESRTLYRYVDGTYAPHSYGSDGLCSACGAACPHSFRDNVCIDCGQAKPEYDYYLFGWINGENYACEENAGELGQYRFVDGQVVVFFTEDSYVGVKASNNESYYMTDGWQGYVSSATLYNTKVLSNPDKLFVPGGTEVTFTLADNGDDTYLLSYTAVECAHVSHSVEGVCTLCGDLVEHSYNADGFCVCGLECDHDMQEGYCTVCGKECAHIYQNNVCTVCGQAKPQFDYYLFGYINGANYACEEDFANLGEYKFVDGKLMVRFDSDSYVAVKASDNNHWYMTEGWQGNVTSVTLYNTDMLTGADKLFVPGGKLVTFTLVDNGDDTYVLSYEAACPHDSHDGEGICDACGETVPHKLQNNICSICGYEKPQYDYYLFGWINGVDYGDKDDAANLGVYRFEDGKLTVFFTEDSYVGVKTSDNRYRYMTDGYLGQVTDATLYNAAAIATEDKLFVPGNQMVTFTLADNGDDTYTISYVAQDCVHEEHDADGVCKLCGQTVEHTYVDGVCGVCGRGCDHTWSNGTCGICGMICAHSWSDGVCDICGSVCGHQWSDGVCAVCGSVCGHSWVEGECSICGVICGHDWHEGICDICGLRCSHTYQNNVCTNCGFAKPVTEYYLAGVINGEDYAWGADAENLGDYRFVDGTLVVIFREDSFVCLKAANNAGWYLTEGDQGQSASVVLYNVAKVLDGQLLWVPGGMEITFTLEDNGDDTLTLRYVAVDCPHASHDQQGVCNACGLTVEHSYETITVPPTCVSEGYVEQCCSLCGYSFISSREEMLPHAMEELERVEASCTEDGYIIYQCADCGEEKTEVLPAPGHSYDAVITAPDCTTEGYTTHTCAACGDSYTDSVVDALGHSYECVTVDATCTADGSHTYTCYCGDSYTEVIAAPGHSYECVTVDATCTEEGSRVYTCHCGDSYTEVIAATGHSYECVTVDATCTADGSRVYTCHCGDSYTEVITATGHSYGEWFLDQVPECDKPGTMVRVCHCGAFQERTLTADGHSYVDGVCQYCGSEQPREMIVPSLVLDHPSLSFEGEIMYNLYFTADDLTDVVEMGLITFDTNLEEGTMETAVNVYAGYIEAGGMYMGQTEGIPAKMLGDAVYFKAYAKLSDGSYVYSSMVGYNAVVYAKSILKNSTNDYMKRLVVAMINYGAEAQIFFGHNAESPMNSFLTEEQQALINAYDASMVADLISVDASKATLFTYNTGDFAKRANSVSFDGAFAINYYFTAKGTPDNGMKLYYWNTADYLAADVLAPENATGSMDMVTGGGNQYWGQISGIAAKEVAETYFVAGVYELDGVTYTTGILAYSLGAYCVKLAADETSDQQALSAATAVYGYYAKEYFANI